MTPSAAISVLTAAGVRNVGCTVHKPVTPAGARIVGQVPAAGATVSADLTVELTSSNRCE